MTSKTSLLLALFLIFTLTLSFSQQIEEVDTSEDSEDVPFAVIEEVPIYPGCKGNNQQKKNCMNLRIQKHVAKNFNSNLADSLGLPPGKKRIYVMFKISKTGNIIDIKTRGPHEALEQEALRIIKLLPKMKPGKQRGKTINVSYMLPIVFHVEQNSIPKEKQ